MAIINRGNKGNLVGTVVAVDALAENIQFCASNEEGSALLTDSVSTSVNALDAAFFDRLGEIVKTQMEKNANMDVQKVSLILPDRLLLLDTLVVPVIHRKAMQQSLSLAVEAIYQNAEELNLMTYAVQQNKQAVTFGLVGVRHDVLNGARAALSTAGAPVNGITFASTAMVNGAMAELANAHMPAGKILMHDWWLAMTGAAMGTVGFLDQATIDYRQHGNNTVGAKDTKSLAYIMKKIRNDGVRKAMEDTYAQAEIFLEAFGDLMAPEQRQVVADYAALKHCSAMDRRIRFLKGGYYKYGVKRIIAQFIWS